MSPSDNFRVRLIWATRGRSWGFRFLLDGGLADPLPTYEAAFRGCEDEAEVWRRQQDLATLRIRDPLGRRDASGRAIPHDFVVLGGVDASVQTRAAAESLIWPLLASAYSSVWNSDKAPRPNDLDFAG